MKYEKLLQITKKLKTNLTALITGASSGIGFELANIFAKNRYNLFLISRSHDKLKSIADELKKNFPVDVNFCAKDLSTSTAPDEIARYLKNEEIEIDVLVNNAGFGWHGEFVQMELSNLLEMIQVNITALTHLTRLILPDMIKRKRGRILNVASTAAFQPGPLMALYYASKSYVLSFSQALSEELRDTNISVTAFCPGPTATNFGKRAGYTNEKILWGMLSMNAHKVALKGYEGLMNDKSVVIPGLLNKAGSQLVRLLPRSLPGKFIKVIQRKRETNI